MTKESLTEKEKRLQELRQAVTLLEQELQKDIESAQHEAIDHLEDHFSVVETKLSSLKVFWRELKKELAAKRAR